MKRAGHLFEAVCSFENLLLASRRAQVAKRFRGEVLRFNHHREDHLLDLQRQLREGSYRPGLHRHFEIFEPKRRWISAAPYRDRVVHHALCNVVAPVFERRFIFDSWANRTGKGTHRAVLRYQGFAARARYALKLDIRKYFPTIDHALLKERFRAFIKDPFVLRLLDVIVDSGRSPDVVDLYFPGDDLFTPSQRPHGLPIGNLTSQLFANVYLDELDHWIKDRPGAPAYLRFVDDFVVLGNSNDELADWRDAIRERLVPLRLALHERKCVIRRTAEGFPFLGYMVWPDRIRVRGETVRRFRRRMRASAPTPASRQSLEAWRGHVRLAGTYRTLGALR